MTQDPEHFVLEDGSERWEIDGKLHREDGPALITPEGETWYRHGQPLSEEETAEKVAKLEAIQQAAQTEALRIEGENVAEKIMEGTARPVTTMKPLRFNP